MKKQAKSNKNLIAAEICILIIVIITALSASNIGWKVESKAAESVKLSDVVVAKLEGEPYGAGPGTPIYTIKVTNSFIPRQYELPFTSVCLYNSELKKTSVADVRWDVPGQISQYDGSNTNTMEIISGTKTANLLVFQGIRYKPVATAPVAVPTKATEEVYDQLLLFLQYEWVYFYRDCYNLQESDFKAAVIIPIIK